MSDYIDRNDPIALDNELQQRPSMSKGTRILKFLFSFFGLYFVYAVILGMFKPPGIFYVLGFVLVVIATYKINVRK